MELRESSDSFPPPKVGAGIGKSVFQASKPPLKPKKILKWKKRSPINANRLLGTFGTRPNAFRCCGISQVGDNFWIFGGDYFGGLNLRDELFVYIPKEDRWEQPFQCGTPPLPRWGTTLCTLQDTKLIVFGGRAYITILNDLNKFDVSSLTWSLIKPGSGPIPSPRWCHIAVSINYNEMLVHGGVHDSRNQNLPWGKVSTTLNDIWIFNIVTSSWRQIQTNSPINIPRESHSAALIDNRLFIYGGCNNGKILSDMIVLNLETMEFILAFGNFIPLQGSCLTSIDDRYLLLFGGEMDLTYRKKSKALKLFDSKTFQWVNDSRISEIGDLPSERAFASAVRIGTTIYIYGGDNKDQTDYDDPTFVFGELLAIETVPSPFSLQTLCIQQITKFFFLYEKLLTEKLPEHLSQAVLDFKKQSELMKNTPVVKTPTVNAHPPDLIILKNQALRILEDLCFDTPTLQFYIKEIASRLELHDLIQSKPLEKQKTALIIALNAIH